MLTGRGDFFQQSYLEKNLWLLDHTLSMNQQYGMVVRKVNAVLHRINRSTMSISHKVIVTL